MSFITVGYECHHCKTLVGLTPAEERMQERAKTTLKYAEKWSPVFKAPLSWIMALAEKESSHDPGKVNMRAKHKGGAWGLLQQMADEATYKLAIIKKFYAKPTSPYRREILATLKKWHGRPRDLLDPDLNVMMAAWQLGRLSRVFDGDFHTAIAAYHQGENAVRRRVAKGLPAVDPETQPKGFAYVEELDELRKKYVPMLLARAEERKMQTPVYASVRP